MAAVYSLVEEVEEVEEAEVVVVVAELVPLLVRNKVFRWDNIQSLHW